MEFLSQEKVYIFKVDKEVTINNIELFQEKMQEFVIYDTEYFILDLNNIHFISNTAFMIILRTAKVAKQQKKNMVIIGVNCYMSEIIDILQLERYTCFFEDCDQAIQYFKQLPDRY